MSEFKQIGTFEVMRPRVYALDPEVPASTVGGSEVLVQPGVYPLFCDGLSYLWVMEGTLNLGGVRRRGDGLIFATRGDVDSGIGVKFPSRIMGEDEFRVLCEHPDGTAGPEQRYQVTLDRAPA